MSGKESRNRILMRLSLQLLEVVSVFKKAKKHHIYPQGMYRKWFHFNGLQKKYSSGDPLSLREKPLPGQQRLYKRMHHKAPQSISRVPKCLSPLRKWDSPTPSPASECASPPPPPGTKGEGGGYTVHSPACKEMGESQFGRLVKKHSTLSTLWDAHSGGNWRKPQGCSLHSAWGQN